MSGTPSTSPHLRIHSINIYVRDQDRSLSFYLDQLGFHLAYDTKLQSGERLVAVAPPDGSAVLSLIVPRRDTPERKLIGHSSRVVFITEDVSAKFQEWSKRGVRFQQTPRLRRINYDPPLPCRRSAGNLAESITHVVHDEASPVQGEEKLISGEVAACFCDIDGNTFLLVSFDECTYALEMQRQAAAARLEAERLAAQELEIASEVQCRFFPRFRPPISALDYCGRCFSARAVGGDYYDFLDFGSKRFGLAIGDVSGKGIAAALLMANLQANLRSQCAMWLDQLQRLMQAVNELFSQNTPDGAFATLFFGDYSVSTGRLRYANCGHLPPVILRRDGSFERLEATGTVLGVFKKWDCKIGESTICAGDTLALYTDGITESFNKQGEEFGEERLMECLRRNRELCSESLVSAIVDEVRVFSNASEQQDDITLIIAKSAGATDWKAN